MVMYFCFFFFFSSRRRHTRFSRDWSSDVCSSDLGSAFSAQVPVLQRAEKSEPYRQQILELLPRCKGNLVRVHEELTASGAVLSYQALTSFCRRHGLSAPPQQPVGQYDFLPGQELQHDTSPHELELAGKKCKVQTASAVLC